MAFITTHQCEWAVVKKLPAGLERAVTAGGPWLFRHIANNETTPAVLWWEPNDGQLVSQHDAVKMPRHNATGPFADISKTDIPYRTVFPVERFETLL